jgi:hypothetical protein
VRALFFSVAVAASALVFSGSVFAKTAACPCNPCRCSPCTCGGVSNQPKPKPAKTAPPSKQQKNAKTEHGKGTTAKTGKRESAHKGKEGHGGHKSHTEVGASLDIDLSRIGRRTREPDPFAFSNAPPVSTTTKGKPKTQERKRDTVTSTDLFSDVELIGQEAKEELAPPSTIEIADTDGNPNRYQPDNYWVVPVPDLRRRAQTGQPTERDIPDHIDFLHGYDGDMLSDPFVSGNDVYNRSGEGQTLNFPNSTPGSASDPNFAFFVQNDGNALDSFTVTAKGGSDSITAKYYVSSGDEDITQEITGSGYLISDLQPGHEGRVFKLVVSIAANAKDNEKTVFTIRSTSNTGGTQDAIKMKVKVHKP